MAFRMDLVPYVFVWGGKSPTFKEGDGHTFFFIVSTAGCEPNSWSVLPTILSHKNPEINMTKPK